MTPTQRKAGGDANRLPWVTCILVGACIAAFLAGEFRARGANAAAETALGAASDYFLEHPYLEPPMRLRPRLDTGVVARALESYRAARQRRGAPELSRGIQRRQQATLDSLVWQWLAEFDSLPSQRWGMHPERRDPLTFATHVFVHSGWLHLVGNLAFLLILGFYLESAWGGTLLAAFVSGGAVASAGAVALASPDLGAPIVGLSGVVAALLGAFATRYAGIWKEGAYAFLLLAGIAWLLLPVWLGTDWSVARVIDSAPSALSSGAASYWSFAAGSAFGAAAAAAIWLLGIEEGRARPARDPRRAWMASPPLERAVQACGEGRFDEAFRLLSNLLGREPENRGAALAMWDVANELGRPGAAASWMLRVIRDDIRRRDRAAAVDHWLSLSAQGLAADAEPALLTRMALLLREADRPAAAVKALHLALERSGNENTTVIASRVARAALDLDPETAEEAAWRALGCAELNLRERQNLEELIAQLHSERKQQDDLLELSTPALAGGAEGGAIPETELEAAAPPEMVQWEAPELLEDSEKPATGPIPIDIDFATRTLKVVPAKPLAIHGEGLVIEVDGGGKRRLDFARVDALSVVAVHGLGPKPVILMDLLLNWTQRGATELKLIRLRADRFDPRHLVSGCETPLEALRRFAEDLLGATRAAPVPDLRSVRGRPFAVLTSLEAYHRDVLMAQETGDARGPAGGS